jgi:hypothetical protein
MSQLEVDKVIPQSGTTLTLGDSADTITIPSGATLDATNATVTYPAGSITDAAISSTAAIQQSKISGSPGFRNIVINGDMSIAQRGTSQATAGSNVGLYQVQDRWKFYNNNQGAFTWSQDTDVPTGQGFATSLKLDCTTADASPAAADYLIMEQSFEGQNLQYLKKGTASAESLTMSFWVKSNKTGTYIAGLFDSDNTRQISKAYTINASNTWEYKSVTFAGDTTGTLDNNNAKSLVALFFLGGGTDITSGTLATSWESYVAANRAVGQVNLADNTSNEWYITGVQLEAGTTASDFEFLPVDVNFERCRRYCQAIGNTPDGNNFGKTSIIGTYYSTTDFYPTYYFQTPMRVTPSFTVSNVALGDVYSNNASRAITNTVNNLTCNTAWQPAITTSSATAGHAGFLEFTSGNYVLFSSEL